MGSTQSSERFCRMTGVDRRAAIEERLAAVSGLNDSFSREQTRANIRRHDCNALSSHSGESRSLGSKKKSARAGEHISPFCSVNYCAHRSANGSPTHHRQVVVLHLRDIRGGIVVTCFP